MNLKSRKIISMALVFFMMLTILPMAPVTAHAASYADAIESITINGTSINMAGDSGTTWEYDPTGALPTIYLNNYNGGPIDIKGKPDADPVHIQIHVSGNCSISASAYAVSLWSYGTGGIRFALADDASLSMEGWCL